jgi:hypothetical protein
MYIIFKQDSGGFGYAYGFKNRKLLAAFYNGSASYGKLTYHFTRLKKTWLVVEGDLIIRVRSDKVFSKSDLVID